MLTNEKFLNKLEKMTSNTVKVIFAIIICILFLYSIVGSAVIDLKEHTTYYNDNILLNVIAILFICVLSIVFKRKKIKMNKTILYSCIAVWFVLCIFWIFLTKLPPKFDQKHILDLAESIKKGDKSFFYKRVIL